MQLRPLLLVLALALAAGSEARAAEGTVTWSDPSCGYFVLTLPEGTPERFGLFSWKSGADPKVDAVWDGNIVDGEDVELTNKASGETMAAIHWASAKEQAQLVRNSPVQCASRWKRKK
ncbi:MAG TPA: hypothetical protein VMH32_19615 [Burkholderiales bacterium]|nr:hypothetical protein [Burkholderiales bacterium]